MTHHKCPFAAINSASFPSSSAASANAAMKKTKSAGPEKNGIRTMHHAEEDDAMLLDEEEIKAGAAGPAATGVAANLSRKKVTRRKPSTKKQLIIKFNKGVKYMQLADVPDYLKDVELRLHEEHERCLLYIDASTRKPLIATTEKQLLQRHTSFILDKGFTMLIEGNRIEDLKRMYNLFQRVNALELLLKSHFHRIYFSNLIL